MKEKSFDCVRMKREIQEGIAEEFKGLSAEERQRRTEALISADPVLARLWRRAHPIGGPKDADPSATEPR